MKLFNHARKVCEQRKDIKLLCSLFRHSGMKIQTKSYFLLIFRISSTVSPLRRFDVPRTGLGRCFQVENEEKLKSVSRNIKTTYFNHAPEEHGRHKEDQAS